MPNDAVREFLTDPHFELLPFEGLYEQADLLPPGSTVALTASPEKGVDETVDRSIELAERGFGVSAHISARAVRDEDHLAEIAERLLEAGIGDVFVPGGDNETPAGPYDSSFAMLEALEDMGYDFERVGIAGYPEGHQFIDGKTLREHLVKKEPYADYIVTQMTFDPEAVGSWAAEIQEESGIELPVIVGVPGVMRYQRLLSISREIGVGDSLSYLRKTTGLFDFIKQFLGSRGQYAPDEFVTGVARYYAEEDSLVDGAHLYTFNQVADTEAWRKQYV
ncbi:MAG: methylenetetrahydrofolate reductase [Halodesulfurarchaeum sp.]